MDNATNWVVDGGQYALDFDGANDYAVTTGNIEISGAQPRTMAGWMNLKSLANAALFGYGESSLNRWFYLSVIGGFWYVSGFNNDFDTLVSAQTGLRHVAVAYDGATVAVVVDGVKIGADAKTYNTTALPLNIARRAFVGSELNAVVAIFDLAIWRRSLSIDEIRQLYQLGRGGMYQRRRRSRIYIPQAGFQAAWARGSNVLLGFQQP